MKGLLESVGLSPEIIAKYCRPAEKKRNDTGISSHQLTRREYMQAYRKIPGNQEKMNERARKYHRKKRQKVMCMRRLRAEQKGSKEVFPKRIRRRMK